MLALLGLLSFCSAPVAAVEQESASRAPEKAAETARDLPSIRVGGHVFERRIPSEDVAERNLEPNPALEALVPDPALEEGEVFYDERSREFEPGRLGNGVFLVATGNLATSMFAESVILIVRYESSGTVGLAVNRPSETPLREAFPDIERLQSENAMLFLGGPVSPRAVFALVRSDRPQPDMERVAEGIYFSHGLDPILKEPSSDFSGDSTRVFAGYAGWAPGQLEAEIERGDWIVAWESPAVAFTRDVRKLWRKLLQAWSGRWT